MTTTLTCLACGYQGPDVQMTIVEVPTGDQRPVEVPLIVATDRLGRPQGIEYRTYPERFVPEPRCPDYNPPRGQPSKCLARIAAMEAAPAAAGHDHPAEEQPMDPVERARADADDPLPAFLR